MKDKIKNQAKKIKENFLEEFNNQYPNVEFVGKVGGDFIIQDSLGFSKI